MSVLRQGNWLGQQRVDIPHIRAVESSIAADFDVAMGLIMGGGTPQIVTGFTLVAVGAVGLPATSLQFKVAGGVVVHYGASESGSIFWVPSTRANETLNSSNANVTGAFTAGTTNYVGMDLIRTADATTADNVQFLDANTLLELSRTVPLGRTLNYRIVISIIPFSSTTNICPIAKVVVDASGNVTSIADARSMLFRLGTGSDLPNNKFAYSFPQGRDEGTSTDPFRGGDKSLGSFADFKQGVLTRLWELGGGEFWYSPTADRGVKLVGSGAVLAGGDYFSWDGTNLTWQNVAFVFSNSNGYFNEIANQTGSSPGLTNLADGECIYVDLDRTQNRARAGTPITAVKAPIQTLGSPTVPGARQILAWRVGATVIVRDRSPLSLVATSTSNGIVTLSTSVPGSSSLPVVATLNASGWASCAGIFRDANTSNAAGGGGAGNLTYTSSVADGGSAVAHLFNTSISLANATAKILSLQNNSTELCFFNTGAVGVPGTNGGSGGPGGNGGNGGNGLTISLSNAIGGVGGNSTQTGSNAGAGGIGGTAITIVAPNGGNGGTDTATGSLAGAGGAGGNGLVITSGNGGTTGQGQGAGNGNTGGPGGIGIVTTGGNGGAAAAAGPGGANNVGGVGGAGLNATGGVGGTFGSGGSAGASGPGVIAQGGNAGVTGGGAGAGIIATGGNPFGGDTTHSGGVGGAFTGGPGSISLIAQAPPARGDGLQSAPLGLGASVAVTSTGIGQVWIDPNSQTMRFTNFWGNQIYVSKWLYFSGVPGATASTTYYLATTANSTAASPTTSSLGTTQYVTPGRTAIQFGLRTSTTTVGGTITVGLFVGGSQVGLSLTLNAGTVAGYYANILTGTPPSLTIGAIVELRVINGVGVTTGVGQCVGFVEIA